MIVVDTNVLAELVRPRANPRVVAWIDAQPAEDLVTTAITVAEMAAGVEMMRLGDRRSEIVAMNAEVLARMAAILPFTAREADAYGRIVAGRQASERAAKSLDNQIAAIAATHGAAVATRNTKDFSGLEIDLIDPWSA
jgi:predicted nucleic acid-binding protein